jgi:hypothetical protein
MELWGSRLVQKEIGDWRARLCRHLSAGVDGLTWGTRGEVQRHTVHLAVLVEPYLEWILQGRKTMESRFSLRRVAPYGAVRVGDLLTLKHSSGPIVGMCRVAHVEFFELDASTREQIRSRYSVPLCAENAAFWEVRAQFRYATLMQLTDVRRLTPYACGKRDRRGWVVLSRPTEGE